MREIRQMRKEEMVALLKAVTFGHLGCARGEQPYVLPISFAYREPYVYFFTTEGTKSDFMAENPRVCFQVEKVGTSERWRSVMILGVAERLMKKPEVREIVDLVGERNPGLVPAIAKTWKEDWGFKPVGAAYRIRVTKMTGRKMG